MPVQTREMILQQFLSDESQLTGLQLVNAVLNKIGLPPTFLAYSSVHLIESLNETPDDIKDSSGKERSLNEKTFFVLKQILEYVNVTIGDLLSVVNVLCPEDHE